MTRLILVLSLLVPPLAAADLAGQAQQILKENCLVCHGAAMQMSGLDLRTQAAILKGGTRGPAVTASDPGKSVLWQLVSHEEKPEMPPGKKLPDDQLETLRQWVLAGAPLVEEAAASVDEAAKAALAKLEERQFTEEERQYWAFQPPVEHKVPAQAGNPIDAFLQRQLQQKALTAAPKANKRTLIRRAYLDLIGLPPSPEEVEEFLRDASPGAWPRLIERLLASPHYGERWGRHWLDLVHYADSGGYERDYDWPSMYRYRDYVIDAFNKDKPYDQFIREQLAGDELAAGKDGPGSAEAHIATGYLRLVMDNNIKDERTRMDELDDYVATTSLTFLGVTVGCARCHDHKFDPIAQQDYYRMQAVFFSTKGVDYPLVPGDVVEQHKEANRLIDERQKPIKEQLAAVEKPYKDKLFEERLRELPEYFQVAWKTPPEERTEGQKLNAQQVERTLNIQSKDIASRLTAGDKAAIGELQAQIKKLDAERPEPYPTARTITEPREPLPSYFLHRGEPGGKGSLMEPGVLTVVARNPVLAPDPPPHATTSWRRKELADWIASPQNPLTARVMVNRIWQHHFGAGIVRTASNFGKTGEPPSHPELLDWLALEFIEKGWSIKAMHRLMMTSDAYQRSSDDVPANLTADAENRFFWRMPRRRVEAEIIRDQILAVAGTLDRAMHGPGIHPYIDPDLFQASTDRTWPGRPVGDAGTWRRSLYVFSKRSIRYPMFEAFDQPDMVTSCARRNDSIVAPQALLLMNNAEVSLQAQKFAERLRAEAGASAEAQVERAFALALARPPTASEKERAVAFIKENPDGLVDFCQTVFNLNEFVYTP